uniref:Uncharacterized protein n=1 Tax=Arundo donax TaxID=35708 RepID=A0A0A9GQF0_ARUDO
MTRFSSPRPNESRLQPLAPLRVRCAPRPSPRALPSHSALRPPLLLCTLFLASLLCAVSQSTGSAATSVQRLVHAVIAATQEKRSPVRGEEIGCPEQEKAEEKGRDMKLCIDRNDKAISERSNLSIDASTEHPERLN